MTKAQTYTIELPKSINLKGIDYHVTIDGDDFFLESDKQNAVIIDGASDLINDAEYECRSSESEEGFDMTNTCQVENYINANIETYIGNHFEEAEILINE